MTFLLDQGGTTKDLDRIQAAIDAISAKRHGTGRRCQRELIIPFGGTGDVALYEIVSP